jgi:glycosyltransferase involved in cell wall biosynthesis
MKKIVSLSANTSWYLYNFRASTIHAFIEKGFQVICLSPKDDYSQKLQALGVEWKELSIDSKGINPFKDLFLAAKFFMLYRKIRPSIAFHFTVKNNIYGTFSAFLLNIPVVNNITGLGTAFIHKNITSVIVRILYKLSQPLAKQVCCQNQEDFDLLLKQNLVPKNCLILLPGSGVNLTRFHPSLRDSFRDQKRVFRFLFAGRILADKGLYELIDAMKIVNAQGINCELWICGFTDSINSSAIPMEVLEEWRANQWVKWVGVSDAVEGIMAQVDCLVLPSYREGMPKCILEANAMSLPVITTDVPGCRNIVSHNVNGLLCKPRDALSLSKAMIDMYKMSEAERASMGEAGHRLIARSYDERLVIQSAVDAVMRNSI